MKMVAMCGVVILSAICAASTTGAEASEVETVDATVVPVLSMTDVVERVGPKDMGRCLIDRGLNADRPRVTVYFDIEEDGATSNVRTGNFEAVVPARVCAGFANRAVRQWTFTPPMKNGVPVRITNAQTSLDFTINRNFREARE